ncbi:hypothetical protein [Melittangium boletus]|uniref:Uncharacterized protein n=1 Tax=Melittangium boletus DSM 14713 TaxID=1294270 RepID=A0A250ICH5_9BACT|nr:hypothetical protein [Melittangium boletus]ATB29554.1 hypothetical protein MEBOL_003009 [Melittangium boletus DSM 14713]
MTTRTPDLHLSPDPLHMLHDQARAPGAGPEDIDALIAECARFLSSEEDKRERAKVLHALLEDTFIEGVAGSDGRRVDVTAAHALVALGETYARELSPWERRLLTEAPTVRASPGTGRKPAPSFLKNLLAQRMRVGALALCWAVIEATVLTHELGDLVGSEGVMAGALMTLVLVVFPALAILVEPRPGNLALHVIPIVLGILGIVGLTPPFVMLMVPLFFIGLSYGGSSGIDVALLSVLALLALLVRLGLVYSLILARRSLRRSRGST